MPTYPMICGKCGHEEELVQSIKLALPEKCPECGSKKYEQNFEARFGVPTIFIDYCCGDAKSAAQQGERNFKKMSEDEKAAHRPKKKKKKKKKPLHERMKEWPK